MCTPTVTPHPPVYSVQTHAQRVAGVLTLTLLLTASTSSSYSPSSFSSFFPFLSFLFFLSSVPPSLHISPRTKDKEDAESHSKHGERSDRRARRDVPIETIDADTDLPPYGVRIQPYPYPSNY